ncbi:hypothetical protein [Naumannella huperziae]
MREMSAARLIIDGRPLEVGDDGAAAAPGVAVRLVGVLIDGGRTEITDWTVQADPDEVNLAGELPGLRVDQRHGADTAWNWRLRLAATGDAEVRVAPIVEIAAADGWVRRAWAGGTDALITVRVPGEPLWAWRPRLGALAVGEPGELAVGGPDDPAGPAELIMAERVLAPGEAYAVHWRGELLPDPAAAAALLPAWLPDRLELADDAEWELELPDAAVVGVPGGPGVHRALVHAGTGSTELIISVPQDLPMLLDAAAGAIMARGGRGGADAVVLLHTAAIGPQHGAIEEAELAVQRPAFDDPLAVIAVATGVNVAGWNDGEIGAELVDAARALPGPGGDLARLHVRAASLVAGAEAGVGQVHGGAAPEEILARLGSGLPGETDGASPASTGLALAWAATLPEELWARFADGLAAPPGEIFDRARSWALARLRPGDASPRAVEALAWLAIHQQLVRG